MNIYPKNTVAKFTTKLPDRIVLDGEYEVALTEILYPASFKNFISNGMGVTYKPKNNPLASFNYSIPSGYFADEEAFCMHLTKGMNRALQMRYGDTVDRITWRFDRHTRKLSFKVVDGQLILNSVAADRLGFSTWEELRIGDEFERVEQFANKHFDLIAGSRLIYVYSDIASYNYVGDIKTPLLRVFNTDGQRGSMVAKTFFRAQYLPVSRREFETIDIQINNEIGTPMLFVTGKVVVTLHFRRANKYL
jgi:hypothetical protein